MSEIAENGDSVACTIRIGKNKWEQFQIVQDEDWKKLIYPERRSAPQSAIVKGPEAKFDLSLS